MHTVVGDGVASIKRCRRDLYSDGVRNIATASGPSRLKEDLESSMWRRQPSFEAPKQPKKPKKRRVRKTQPEPEPSHQHSDSEFSAGSLDFKVIDNNVPTTERVIAKNLQNFSSFLYAQLSKDNRVKHEEAATSYVDLKAVVEDYAEENAEHIVHIDTSLGNTMDLIDNINKEMVDEHTTHLKFLNRVTETLEADSALKATMQKMAETNTTTYGNITNLTKLIRNANLPEIITQMNTFQTSLNSLSSQCASILESLKEDPEFNQSLQKRITNVENTQVTMQADISSIKEMVTKMFAAFKGLYSSTPSATEEKDIEVVKVNKEPGDEHQDTEPISITIVRPIAKYVPEVELIGSSRTKFTNTVIDITPLEQRNHKEQYEDTSFITPKDNKGKGIARDIIESPRWSNALRSKKGGQEFLKQQDAELSVLRREHMAKLKKLTKLKRKRYHQKRKALELEPEVCIAGIECNKSLPEGIHFMNNKVIETPEHEIFFIDAFDEHAFQRVSDIHKVEVETLLGYLVMAGNVKTPENQRFCVLLRQMIDAHPDKERLESKKVKLEVIGYSFN
ncbi:hypothetical protein Tco_0558709 [Tanacetum coccineum]